VAGEDQRRGDAADHAPVADLDVGVLDRPRPQRAGHALAGDHLGRARHPSAVAVREADELGVRNDRVERELEVRMLGRGEVGGGDREPVGLGAEVLADAVDQLVPRADGGGAQASMKSSKAAPNAAGSGSSAIRPSVLPA
jgi:hypothetical protein